MVPTMTHQTSYGIVRATKSSASRRPPPAASSKPMLKSTNDIWIREAEEFLSLCFAPGWINPDNNPSEYHKSWEPIRKKLKELKHYDQLQGTDVTTRVIEYFSKADNNRFTALHVACISRPPPDIIQAFIKQSAAPLRWKSYDDQLPIHLACSMGTSDDATMLLYKAYPASKEIADALGRTPLHLIFDQAQRNLPSPDIVEELLSSKAMTMTDFQGKTPVQLFQDRANVMDFSEADERLKCVDIMIAFLDKVRRDRVELYDAAEMSTMLWIFLDKISLYATEKNAEETEAAGIIVATIIHILLQLPNRQRLIFDKYNKKKLTKVLTSALLENPSKIAQVWKLKLDIGANEWNCSRPAHSHETYAGSNWAFFLGHALVPVQFITRAVVNTVQFLQNKFVKNNGQERVEGGELLSILTIFIDIAKDVFAGGSTTAKEEEFEKTLAFVLTSETCTMVKLYDYLRQFPAEVLDRAVGDEAFQHFLGQRMLTKTSTLILSLDFVFYCVNIVCFGFAIQNQNRAQQPLSGSEWHRPNWYILLLYCGTCYFGLRELLQMLSLRKMCKFEMWVRNWRNRLDVINIVFLAISTSIMHTGWGDDLTCQIVLTATAGMVWIIMMLKLSCVYKDIAIFVVGLWNIIAVLIPFLITTLIVLGAFAFMYYSMYQTDPALVKKCASGVDNLNIPLSTTLATEGMGAYVYDPILSTAKDRFASLCFNRLAQEGSQCQEYNENMFGVLLDSSRCCSTDSTVLRGLCSKIYLEVVDAGFVPKSDEKETFLSSRQSATVSAPSGRPFCSIENSLLNTYVMLVGGVDSSDFEQGAGVTLISIAFAFIVVILLLNVIIAIVSSKFETVQQDGVNVFLKEQMDFIVEVEAIEALCTPSNKENDSPMVKQTSSQHSFTPRAA